MGPLVLSLCALVSAPPTTTPTPKAPPLPTAPTTAPPTTTTATTTTPAAPLVLGDTFTLTSTALGGEVRRINVYRPAVPPEQALPVLYMPDGGVFEDFVHVAGLVQVLVGNGGMRPFLLVGIENTERRRDLTPVTHVDDDKKIAPRVGGAVAFRAFLHELMPVIEARYRTTPERAIMGESLAGLFVVDTLLHEPALFDAWLAFDPSLWWDKRRLLDEAAGFSVHSGAGERVFLAHSDEPDLADTTTKLAAALSTKPQLQVTTLPLPQETHATLYHPAALAGLRALFAPPKR